MFGYTRDAESAFTLEERRAAPLLSEVSVHLAALAEAASGAFRSRPSLSRTLANLAAGYTLVVWAARPARTFAA
jgi:hypothetical protein